MWGSLSAHPRLRDLGVAAAFGVLGVVLHVSGLTAVGGSEGGPFALPGWVALLTLAAACAAQTLRSTRPGLCLTLCLAVVGIDALVAQSISVWLVLSDVLYAVALYAGRRTVHVMYATMGGIGAVVVVGTLAVSDDWRVVVLITLWLLALVVSPIGYGRAIAEHRSAAQSERERALAVAELAARDRADAVAAERRALARDLHDVIAGHLSGIALQSAAALRAGPASPVSAEVLASVRAASVEALGEMRVMIDALGGGDSSPDTRSGDAPGPRTTASLRRLDHLVTAARATGSPVTVTGDPVPDLPPAVDVCAHRIVSEGLANATRHAPAQPISLHVDTDDTRLTVTMRNRVPGGAPGPDRPSRGHGLVNMTTRAESAGGLCSAGRDGDDWVVTATLPVRLDAPACPIGTPAGPR